MRVFVSVEIPLEIKKEIKKIQESLPEFFGKKSELDKLHLTLKFLGEISEEKVEELKKRLKKIKFKKFKCSLGKIGFFSEGKNIRIIWVGLDDCKLNELQKKIDKLFPDFISEHKKFNSHITIAKVKKTNNKTEFLKQLKEIKILNIEFEINEFSLMKSILIRQGHIHENIENFKLD